MRVKRRWSIIETETLNRSLEAGISYKKIQNTLPKRTRKAILRKALYLGWSSTKVDDDYIFIHNIKRRIRIKKEEPLREGSHLKDVSHIIAKFEPLSYCFYRLKKVASNVHTWFKNAS